MPEARARGDPSAASSVCASESAEAGWGPRDCRRRLFPHNRVTRRSLGSWTSHKPPRLKTFRTGTLPALLFRRVDSQSTPPRRERHGPDGTGGEIFGRGRDDGPHVGGGGDDP